ncbi:hypothetical protein C8J57DRAFT_1449901 [Mycena rebaudengoi]|nr:hypothetical protein C8J57DRAFT_1449901 [Mycena rebaudengoi]
MPSIFSRARTSSTGGGRGKDKDKDKDKARPPLPLSLGGPDEFGVSSSSAHRARTVSYATPLSPGGAAGGAGDGEFAGIGFLPTATTAAAAAPPSLSSSTNSTSSSISSINGFNGDAYTGFRPHAYGLLSPARDAVLGLADVVRLTARVCEEMEREGVATPFVFSALALDVRRAGVARLVKAFLGTCEGSQSAAAAKWAEEARFAGPHELGMCLRWGLSRVVRVEGGREVRGLLSWTWYERWRAEEAAAGYPPTAFASFLSSLPAQLPPIIEPLFALASRLVAHSNVSGETPPSLASVLGPLLFGLSPPSLASAYPVHATPTKDGKTSAEDLLIPTIDDFSSFGETYAAYLRGARAAEHLLLAAIRQGISGTGAAGLGVPTRLREWVAGYPMSLDRTEATGAGGGGKPKGGARRGAKTVRVVHVRRNVRAYASDLVRGGSTWASSSAPAGPTSSTSAQGGSGWGGSKAWRGVLAGGSGAPRYADSYRKRMDLGAGVQPDTGASSSSSSSSSPYGAIVYGSSVQVGAQQANQSALGLGLGMGGMGGSNATLVDDGAAEKFRSLTDLKWGEFESLGFGDNGGGGAGGGGFGFSGGGAGKGAGGIEGKLRFDLTENARAERLAKRETLSWSDFSSAGFTRSDAPLSATLQFSPPLTLSSPSTLSGAGLNAEMTRKLRKAHKALPAFGWDTAPVLGAEEVVEEAFLDVFCDLLWGGGWMERAAGVAGPGAELARECSWALVEYKSRSGGAQDPGSTIVLYEEFVPREYRLALAGAAPPGSRRRLPSLFAPAAPSGGKTWKQAATLNGRPYVLGATPISPSRRETDFEGMLRAQGNATKVITLAGTVKRPAKDGAAEPGAASPMSPMSPQAIARTKTDETSSAESGGGGNSKRISGSRFRLPGGMLPSPSPGGIMGVGGVGGGGGPRVRAGMAPAEHVAVEFETRLAGESDDEGGGEEEAAKQRRRESASDAWVDILVGSEEGGRVCWEPDPDLMSKEVAQAMAAVTLAREDSPAPREDPEEARRRQRAEERERLRDSDVVEIETVPRTSEASNRSMDNSEYTVTDAEEPDEDDDEAVTPNAAQLHPVLSQRQEARQQRRLGYFDLHPERRPPSVISTNDDDPRSLLSGTDSEEDDHEIPVPRNLDTIRPLPIPGSPAQPTPSPRTDSLPLPSAPQPSTNGHGDAHIVAPKPGAPSKTSALIDMFREREQRTTPAKPAAPAPAPVAPSKLPPAAASPAKPVSPLPKTPPAPAATSLPKSPAPAPKGALLDPAAIEPPPVIPAAESGRASPARYVHGAPLHNVLEEEEEEP